MTAALLRPATGTPVPPFQVRRFTVAEYHRMIQDGYFAADESFELLDGLIVRTMPRNPIHDACLNQTRDVLGPRLPAGWHVRVQSAVTTSDSEPEPDLAIVRGRHVDYVSRHPGPADVSVLIEVANSSLAEDRLWKGSIYARAGFACYWIVNLIDRQIEVYTDPFGTGDAASYRRREDYPAGHSVPLMIPGAVAPVPVSDIVL